MAATFGELIAQLKNNPLVCGLEPVFLMINGEKTFQTPTDVCSWRGSYEKGCIEPGDRPVNVRDVLKMLERAIDGRRFTAWKGGEYYFYNNTHVWFGQEGVYQEVACQVFVLDGAVMYLAVSDEKY